MNFEFATANRVIFGAGSVKQAAPLAASFGKNILLVLGSAPQRGAALLGELRSLGLTVTTLQVRGEPTIDSTLQAVETARQAGVEVVLGLGGGSVLDASKAIAGLVPNLGDIYDYLEVIGRAQPLKNLALPVIAIPTTAGTGSEVTRNAVLASPEQRVKVSLRHLSMLPKIAIVDPELTYSLPPSITASTGLDALTQLIEPYLSNASNHLTDALCREGIRHAAHSLQKACEQGDDPEARESMALASLFGGMALANAKLGAVHGFAGPIGGMFPAPHGAVCARLLPLVLEANYHALSAQNPHSPILGRFTKLTKMLIPDQPFTTALDGIRWLDSLCRRLDIPPLREYGITSADIPAIVAQAQKASSMKGNPIVLDEAALRGILEKAL